MHGVVLTKLSLRQVPLTKMHKVFLTKLSLHQVPLTKMHLLGLLNPKQVVCIGDHKQLQPFSNVKEGFMQSFLEYLVEVLPTGSVPMLQEQYRCPLFPLRDGFLDSLIQCQQDAPRHR